jgi:hypothetical protein
MGIDDLLLGLTQHWSRDRSIFPTEDDRLDQATIMLFQAYTACRPAELVDGRKSRGDQDPLQAEPGDITPKSFLPTPKDSDNLKDAYQGFGSDVDENNKADTVFDECDGYHSDITDDTKFETEPIDDLNTNYNIISKSAKIPSITGTNTHIDSLQRPKTLCYKDITL